MTLLGTLAAYFLPPLFLVFKDSFLWFLPRLGFTAAVFIGTVAPGNGAGTQHFIPETVLPGALFAVCCILTAVGASSYLRRYQLFT